ncbi:hypothetical protein [Providencia rettgeri]|uniref:hypothetical protein n=1 Tax=Providencia rettgeri TaxID=587 RepID=UPI00204A2B8A|nr:hypothetical protein [Providencia rettgeri]UPS62238.1 hypothetical protein M0M83_16715 [Providencia rettgeri]
MGKILTTLKVLIILFLVLFFAAGLSLTVSPDEKNKGVSIFMLIVTGSLIVGLSRWWFFSGKTKEKKQEKPIKKNNEIEEQAAKEFSERQITQQLQSATKPPVIFTVDEGTENNINKTYVMENNKSLVWEGTTKLASFKIVDHRDKIYGIITSLIIKNDGEFYLNITDPETGETTEIKEKEIQTKIIVGSTRYDFVELCRKVLKLDLHEMFEYAKSIRYEAKELHLVAEFPPIKSTFTYISSSGKNKRTIDIDQYFKNGYGDEYIGGFCYTRMEHRTFLASRIQTMISSDGHKKYYFHDWLKNVAGITNHDS